MLVWEGSGTPRNVWLTSILASMVFLNGQVAKMGAIERVSMVRCSSRPMIRHMVPIKMHTRSRSERLVGCKYSHSANRHAMDCFLPGTRCGGLLSDTKMDTTHFCWVHKFDTYFLAF